MPLEKLKPNGDKIGQTLEDAGLCPSIIREYLERIVVFKEVIRFNRANFSNDEYIHKEMVVTQVSILKDLLDEGSVAEFLEVSELSLEKFKWHRERLRQALIHEKLESSLIYEFLVYQSEISEEVHPFDKSELSEHDFRKYEVMAQQIKLLMRLLR